MARTAKKASASKAPRTAKRTKGTKAAAKKSAPKKAAARKGAARKSAAKSPKKAQTKATKAPPKKAATASKKPAAKSTPKGKKVAAKKAPSKTAPAKAPGKAPEEAAPVAEKAPAAKAPAAKPPVKAPEAPPKPKKPRKPEVTPKAIEKIRETLEQQRAALFREFSDLEEGTFSLSQSDMSGEASFDEEYADAGSYTFEREKDLSIGNNIRDLLEKVTHALDRIDRGTYGLCENCGDPINKDRLLALPYSSLCIRCKQREERTR